MTILHYYLDMLAYYFLYYFQETTDVATFLITVTNLFLILTSMSMASMLIIKYKAVPLTIFLALLTYLAFTFYSKCNSQATDRAEQKQIITKYENNYKSEDGKVSVSCTNLVNFNNDQCTIEVVRIKTITPWGFAPEKETGWIRTYNTERFDYE